MGSYLPHHKKGEKLEDGAWTDINDAPVPIDRFSSYVVIFYDGSFFYFGGLKDRELRSILRLDSYSWEWSNVGQLNSFRSKHGVILVDKTFMVIGGSSTRSNEACLYNKGRFTCDKKASSLTNYQGYPLLFLVDANYGNC